MGQSENCAAVKDVQTEPSVKVCAGGMGQRSSDASVKYAQTKLSKEELVVPLFLSTTVKVIRANAERKRESSSEEDVTPKHKKVHKKK